MFANSQTIPLSYWVQSITYLIVLCILRYTKKGQSNTKRSPVPYVYIYDWENELFKNFHWVQNGFKQNGFRPNLKIGRPDKFKPSLHPQFPKDKVSLLNPHLTTRRHILKHLKLFPRILAVNANTRGLFRATGFYQNWSQVAWNRQERWFCIFSSEELSQLLDYYFQHHQLPAAPHQFIFYIFPPNLQTEKRSTKQKLHQ